MERKNLKQVRIAKGYSVVELAGLVGVSPSVYYKWEDGSRAPLLANAKQVAKVLGCSVEKLFFRFELDNLSKRSDDHPPNMRRTG